MCNTSRSKGDSSSAGHQDKTVVMAAYKTPKSDCDRRGILRDTARSDCDRREVLV